VPTTAARLRTRPRPPIALTGTPGTGKSRVARALRPLRAVEVADLALAWSVASRIRGGVEVDVPAFLRRARRPGALRDFDVIVGHLAHLLPLRDVVLLRCQPIELDRRLRAARRGTEQTRAQNVAAEATDVIRWEAVRPGRRILQVDTSRQSVASVASLVAAFARTRRVGRAVRIDWLADPAVTDYLLDRAP
jgi:adenylate kinase